MDGELARNRTTLLRWHGWSNATTLTITGEAFPRCWLCLSRPFSRRVGLARWKCPQGSMVIILFHLFYDYLLLVSHKKTVGPRSCFASRSLVLVLFAPTLSAVFPRVYPFSLSTLYLFSALYKRSKQAAHSFIHQFPQSDPLFERLLTNPIRRKRIRTL